MKKLFLIISIIAIVMVLIIKSTIPHHSQHVGAEPSNTSAAESIDHSLPVSPTTSSNASPTASISPTPTVTKTPDENRGYAGSSNPNAWFNENKNRHGYPPSDPRYDGDVLKLPTERDARDPWHEQSFPLELEKIFAVELFTLADPVHKIQFKLKLSRKDLSPELKPSWLELISHGEGVRRSRYNEFQSSFADQEVYPGTLYFPYDSVWQTIIPEKKCKEISVIHEIITADGYTRKVEYFEARVFCRTGLKDLVGVAQLRAHVTQESEKE